MFTASSLEIRCGDTPRLSFSGTKPYGLRTPSSLSRGVRSSVLMPFDRIAENVRGNSSVEPAPLRAILT